MGAVEIEKVQAALANTTDGGQVKQLQARLETLEAQYPFAAVVREQFSDQWSLVRQAVAIEELLDRLEGARAAGSPEVGKLEKELEAMKAEMPDLDVAALQREAAEAWARMQVRAVLPDLDDVVGAATKVVGSAAGIVSEILSGLYR